ncbi:TrkH family potassium uptake protein [Paracoccus sp. (in: a-proteobacteria)]|uniref:TrkH family potassium uptake protein n=1 Tax=Paracoccus sp. TaxID=267 RepID=UPI0026DF17B8|nr:TrkH family potassium uptake protein [Paracoccus sp. (in: a-proteobacteria)]MDO5368904.1 TrkH family potassium uptake protein [Paracoccus sp. (in: a-proteobacteria)]
MIDIRPVVHAIAKLSVAMGGLMLLPAAIDWMAGDPNWLAFLATGCGTILLGSMAMLATRSDGGRFQIEQAFLLTSGLWLVLPVLGAVPFMLGAPGAGWTDAMFEAMSGMTTTGATAFRDLDGLPLGTHLWRGILQWSGGLGIVVVAMVFLPVMRVGGMQFFRSEGFDTMGKVMPRAGQIAAEMSYLYLGITLACALTYAALGMNGFDAVMHALTTCSTGGFGRYDASFGPFVGPIQYAASFFTILASIPFVRMLQLAHGDPQPIWRDSQIRAYLGIIAAVCVLIVTYEAIWREVALSFDLMREVVFNVVTVISGTGFFTVDVTQWGHLPFVLLILVGLVGGCTGSTVCSIKVFRYQVLFEALRGQLVQMHSPHRVRPLRLQGRRLDAEVVNSVMAFFTMFVLSFGVLIVALALSGLHARTALTAAWTAIANVGPVWGPEVTANGGVTSFPGTAKWLMIGGMYLGRLELITVFVVLMPRFWRQ